MLEWTGYEAADVPKQWAGGSRRWSITIERAPS